jgi:hypothetical protein
MMHSPVTIYVLSLEITCTVLMMRVSQMRMLARSSMEMQFGLPCMNAHATMSELCPSSLPRYALVMETSGHQTLM